MPKSRNNSAFGALQNYFDRVSNSLEDRIPEYLQMRKYARVYAESRKLLEIGKTLNLAAGSIDEINLTNKLNGDNLRQFAELLNARSLPLRTYLQGKPLTKEIKLLHFIFKNLQQTIKALVTIHKNLKRINAVIPVIGALLKLKENDSDKEHDPVLHEISSSLKANLMLPELDPIKIALIREGSPFSDQLTRLGFEQINDVSDKLIGLLNDKLLVVLEASEVLINSIESDGVNDVSVEKRLPDEVRVLFLAQSVLDIFFKIREIRNCIKIIISFMNDLKDVLEGRKLDMKAEALLCLSDNSAKDNSIRDIVLKHLPTNLRRGVPVINEIATSLDALDLKLRLNTLDLTKILKMTYGLIYEKSTRNWINPYED
ncbi:MAG: hypothetical protein PHP00_05940 [Thiotrichaceae bacterium]|nr:hypothetical protein [Thiotrichaceae bacterium]